MGNTTSIKISERRLITLFQSPYGEMGNTTTKLSKLPIKQLSTSFSPLTGKWVIRLENPSTITGIKWWFQSPYGEMGNTTRWSAILLVDTRKFQSPYGEMGNTTRITSLPLSERQTSFSPLTGKWVIRPVTTVTPGWKSTSFSPLTGKWVIRHVTTHFRVSCSMRVSVPLRGNG